MKYFLCLLFFVSACASKDKKNKQTDIYISSGTEKFFMSQRPSWGQFSEIASCYQPEIQFIDYEQIKKNYQFNYQQSSYFQALFHQSYEKVKQKNLSKSEENKFFYEVYQQIDSGALPFPPIRSQKVYVVLVDSYISRNTKRLKSYIENNLLTKGQVFLLSRCMSSTQLNQWKQEEGIYDRVESLGFDYFSVFDHKFKKQARFGISLDHIFDGKDIYLITHRDYEHIHITGFKKKWRY